MGKGKAAGGKETDVDRATRFALDGLSEYALERLTAIAHSDALTTWKPRQLHLLRGGVDVDSLIAGKLRELQATALKDARSAIPGIRLTMPALELAGSPEFDDVVREIAGSADYQAANNAKAWESGLASLSIDTGSIGDRGRGAFGWPLQFVANEAARKRLFHSRAVMRGLVRFVEPIQPPMPDDWRHFTYPDIPRVLVKFVEFPAGPSAEYLALTFEQTPTWHLPNILNPANLQEIGPTVLFPVGGTDPAMRLTEFVYGLSHDLPLDVAAWRATQHTIGESPLVFARPSFLSSARISTTINATRERLRGFNPDLRFPIVPEDLDRFGVVLSPGLATTGYARVGDVIDLLDRQEGFDYQREDFVATGLARVDQGIEALVLATTARVEKMHAGPAPAMPPPSVLDPTAPAETPPLGPPDPQKNEQRHTDLILFDAAGRQLLTTDPLVQGEVYTLDVAIRVKRRGLAKDRTDQPWVEIPGATGTEEVWVGISDDSVDGRAFEAFEGQYQMITLPMRGDSENSARFEIRPLDSGKSKNRGRIGVRLYHKLNLIDHLELDMRVVKPGETKTKADDGAIAVRFMGARAETGVEPPSQSSLPRALTISISKSPGDARYRVVFARRKRANGEPELAGHSDLLDQALDDFLVRYRDLLLETVFGPALGQLQFKPAQRDQFFGKAAKLGQDIVHKLFDYSGGGDLFEISEMARNSFDETDIVQISLGMGAEHLVLPWQILVVDPTNIERPPAENFWGYRFAIEVKRIGDAVDNRSKTAIAAGAPIIHYGCWKFYNETEHRQALANILSPYGLAGQLDAPILNRAAFVDALSGGGGNLFYIYAHGASEPPQSPALAGVKKNLRSRTDSVRKQLNRSKSPDETLLQAVASYERLLQLTTSNEYTALILENETITLAQLTGELAKRRARLGDAPIIVLNTCDSGQIWNTAQGSFVRLFLDRGARAVLGTESIMPIVLSDAFGRRLFEQLFGGKTIGEAVRAVRCNLLNQENNPLGLSYCLYGAADARLFADLTTEGDLL